MYRPTALLLIVSLLLGLLLAGCAPAAQPTPSPTVAATLAPAATPQLATAAPALATATPTSVTPAEPPTITVVDDLDRTVTVALPAQRIVSLAPNLTETLFAVGAGDQVVGVTMFCDYPEAALTRTQVGGFTSDTISIEQIVALDPDLVLATGGFQLETIQALEPLGIPVIALDPNSLDTVMAMIELLGQLTGHDAEAAAVVADMTQRMAVVTGIAAGIPAEERLTVYWQIWDEPLMSAGPKAFPGQLIDLAGGSNVFADSGEFYPMVSAEEVVSRNPQVIMGPNSHGDRLTIETFQQRPGWTEIEAVVNGRIHVVDDNIISRAGPRLVDALEDIAQALYPEIYQ
jgi:iron complex transport system substrate-binding protein